MRIPFPLVQREVVRSAEGCVRARNRAERRGITVGIAGVFFNCSAAEIGDVNVIRVIGHDARGFEEPRNRRVRGGVAFGAFGETIIPVCSSDLWTMTGTSFAALTSGSFSVDTGEQWC